MISHSWTPIDIKGRGEGMYGAAITELLKLQRAMGISNILRTRDGPASYGGIGEVGAYQIAETL